MIGNSVSIVKVRDVFYRDTVGVGVARGGAVLGDFGSGL